MSTTPTRCASPCFPSTSNTLQTDLQDMWGALLLQHIAKVKETSRVGGGDNRDHTLPTQSHLYGHLLAMYFQSLTVLENSRGSVVKTFVSICNVKIISLEQGTVIIRSNSTPVCHLSPQRGTEGQYQGLLFSRSYSSKSIPKRKNTIYIQHRWPQLGNRQRKAAVNRLLLLLFFSISQVLVVSN